MPEPLRIVEALGAEIERATAQPPRRPRGRTLLVAVAVLLGLTGVAGATSYVLTGSPIPGANEQDLPLDQRLEPGTARLAGAEAEDPGGGPKWDLRVSRSQTGELCTAVGQVQDGTFGLVGLDGRFRELPLQGVDACGSDPEARPAFIGAREFAADRPEDRRTVVNGVGGDDLEDVEVEGSDVARGAGGTFVAVFRGGVDQARPTVRLRFKDGTEREYRFGQSRFAEVPDPEGKVAWTVRADTRPDGRHCAQGSPAERLGPIALTPAVCGDLQRDHVFFDVRPFAMDRDRGPYPWMFEPRTLVWGAADETVDRVEVAYAGEQETVRRNTTDPGFLAVLPAGTRPADVEVTVVFEDGRRTAARGAHNLRDSEGNPIERPLLEPPEPDGPPPMDVGLRPVEGSDRIVARHPLDGLHVAARAFDSREGRCAEIGWLAPDGTFGARNRDGQVRSRPLGRMVAACGQSQIWAQLLDDGHAYAPRVVGAFAIGFAPGAREVEVRGFGKPLTARPDEHGLYFAVTDHTERPEGYDVIVDGRSTRNPGFTPSPVVPGSVRVVARAPDPSGLQPYGMLEWKQDARTTCAYEGPLVGDMAGSVNPESGTFFPYPLHEGGSCGEPPDPAGVQFHVSTGGAERQGERTQTEIARRVLPGRSILSGHVGPDVRRVILQTPRDVRAFRPGPSGAFLVVHDGILTMGTITAIAELAGGRTTRQTMELDR